MMFLRLTPVILANLVFAAHMSRSNSNILALIVLLFTFSLLIKKSWLIRVWQVYLLGAGVLWLVDMIGYVQLRMAAGTPWIRLAVILSVVALFTFFAAYWLEKPAIKNVYK